MDKHDLNEIFRKNPNLDRKALDALQKSLDEIPKIKTRYRLVPHGTHRATIVRPDSVAERPKRRRSYPGF